MDDLEHEKLTNDEIHTLKELAKDMQALSRVGRLLKFVLIGLGGIMVTWIAIGEKILLFFKKLGTS